MSNLHVVQYGDFVIIRERLLKAKKAAHCLGTVEDIHETRKRDQKPIRVREMENPKLPFCYDFNLDESEIIPLQESEMIAIMAKHEKGGKNGPQEALAELRAIAHASTAEVAVPGDKAIVYHQGNPWTAETFVELLPLSAFTDEQKAELKAAYVRDIDEAMFLLAQFDQAYTEALGNLPPESGPCVTLVPAQPKEDLAPKKTFGRRAIAPGVASPDEAPAPERHLGYTVDPKPAQAPRPQAAPAPKVADEAYVEPYTEFLPNGYAVMLYSRIGAQKPSITRANVLIVTPDGEPKFAAVNYSGFAGGGIYTDLDKRGIQFADSYDFGLVHKTILNLGRDSQIVKVADTNEAKLHMARLCHERNKDQVPF